MNIHGVGRRPTMHGKWRQPFDYWIQWLCCMHPKPPIQLSCGAFSARRGGRLKEQRPTAPISTRRLGIGPTVRPCRFSPTTVSGYCNPWVYKRLRKRYLKAKHTLGRSIKRSGLPGDFCEIYWAIYENTPQPPNGILFPSTSNSCVWPVYLLPGLIRR